MSYRTFQQGERVTWTDSRRRGRVLASYPERSEAGVKDDAEQVLVMAEGTHHVSAVPSAILVEAEAAERVVD